jgi:hypothetical protein
MPITLNGTTGITSPGGDTSTSLTTASLVVSGTSNTSALTVNNVALGAGNATRFKNRFINGDMRLAQRATSATVTAGTTVPTASTGYPSVDRWFVYSVGGNPTAAQVAGSNSTQNTFQITGAASVTSIGVGQRIENNNSYDLAGQTVTLSANISNSLLTNVTWTASYANTSNTFGTIGTPTKTQISTGTFTVNSNLTQYSTQISIPAAATTGIEILFTVGAQTSGTWVIGNAQLEVGSSATGFEYVDYTTQLAMCQRYYQKLGGAAANDIAIGAYGNIGTYIYIPLTLPVSMRTSPTGTATGTWGGASLGNPNPYATSPTTISLQLGYGFTGMGYSFSSTTAFLTVSAEL